MRNLHLHIKKEFCKESALLLRKWEHLVRKIADFGSYRKFSLRYLVEGILPVSVKLKNTVRTPKNYEIIIKVERQLLNECARTINNTIQLSSLQRDACIEQ